MWRGDERKNRARAVVVPAGGADGLRSCIRPPSTEKRVFLLYCWFVQE